MEDSSLIGTLTNTLKELCRALGVAGAVISVMLVIYYCFSINFYPLELTIADLKHKPPEKYAIAF